MSNDSTVGLALGLGDWIDPLEQALRDGVNSTLRELLELVPELATKYKSSFAGLHGFCAFRV